MHTGSVEIRDQTLRLSDGRSLGYAEYGRADGKAMFYFGASRLEAGFLASPAERAGVRLIGTDRPGMGLSQFQPNRSLLDWSRDVVELADHLQIDRFAVVGVSGGGPYALVCAHSIPDRLTTCGVVSGVGPVVVSLYQRLPWMLIPMMWLMGRFFQNESQARKSMVRFTRQWPESDRDGLRIPDIGDTLAASMAEAFHQGSRGLTYDTILGQGRPWGFQLEDVTFPRISLWHGEHDRDVPIAMGQAIAERIPQCIATYYPEGGHISVLANHRDEIMKTLVL